MKRPFPQISRFFRMTDGRERYSMGFIPLYRTVARVCDGLHRWGQDFQIFPDNPHAHTFSHRSETLELLQHPARCRVVVRRLSFGVAQDKL